MLAYPRLDGLPRGEAPASAGPVGHLPASIRRKLRKQRAGGGEMCIDFRDLVLLALGGKFGSGSLAAGDRAFGCLPVVPVAAEL